MTHEAVDLVHARAKYAYGRVERWSRGRETAQEVKGLPISIRTLGLAQGTAMLLRRSAAARQLADDLAGWLLSAAPTRSLASSSDSGHTDAASLVERVVRSSPEAVRAAEVEAVHFLEVLKLFAELKHGDAAS